jgi:putative addiction module component (TIGR02574 family)
VPILSVDRRMTFRYYTAMTEPSRKILKEALDLPEDERADLVCSLLDSFGAPPQSSERSDEEWIAEIERRARAAMAGEPGIPWDEARAEIERRLSRR